MSNIRIFVTKEDDAESVYNQIARLYPEMKKNNAFIEIQITLPQGCDSSLITEITQRIESSGLLEYRDRFYFDSM